MKILNVTDEFTREALVTNVAKHIMAAGTMAVLAQIRELRGAPMFLRIGNGPEFIADTLRDCRREQNRKVNHYDPNSPGQNGLV